MTTGVPLAREEIAEIPSVGLDLRPGGRLVRTFLRGPDAGIRPDTGVTVILHGIGGRANDILYKRARRDAANRHNMLVVGLNFLGTEAAWADVPFASEHATGLVKRFLGHLEGVMFTGDVTHARMTLDRWQYQGVFNKFWADQLEQESPSDFWDYGAIQALDVLCVLDWIQRHLESRGIGRGSRPVHLVAQSAGCQTALVCAKLAPECVSTMLLIGALALTGTETPSIEQILTDPWAHISPNHGRHVSVTINEQVTAAVWCRALVGFRPDADPPPATGPLLADQASLRSIGGTGTPLTGARVQAIQSSMDQIIRPPQLRPILDKCVRDPAQVRVHSVTQPEVDGKIITSLDHAFTTDVASMMDRFGPGLWADPPRAVSVRQAANVSLPSPNGEWRVEFEQGPAIRFERWSAQ